MDSITPASGPRKRKSRWATGDDDDDTTTTQLQQQPTINNSTSLPSGTQPDLTNPHSHSDVLSNLGAPSGPLAQALEQALLVSPLPHEIPPETKPHPNLPPPARISRWTIANDQREIEVHHDTQGANVWQSITNKQQPTFLVPPDLTPEQTHRIAILHSQIEDLYRRIKMPGPAMEKIPNRDRSPSPAATYDISGHRLNTRQQRFVTLCEAIRGKLIREMMTMVPNYQAEGYRREKPFRNVPIPVDERPEYNFSGLIIGPRGTTHQKMEADFNCKVSIRGRLTNEVKPKKNEWSNDPAHVHVEGDDEEQVIACAAAIQELILMSATPDEQNEHKSKQLAELGRYNGTISAELRERERRLETKMERQRNISNYQGPGVTCNHCGSGNHITQDCPHKDRDFTSELLQHEQSMMAGSEFVDLSTSKDGVIMAPPRPRLVKGGGSGAGIGGGGEGVLDLSTAMGPPRPQRQHGGPRDSSDPYGNPGNSGNNDNHNNNNNYNAYNNPNNFNNPNNPPIGAVKYTPQGPLVNTPSGPIPFVHMTNDQKTKLAQIVATQHGMTNPYFQLLMEFNLDPIMVLNGGLMQPQMNMGMGAMGMNMGAMTPQQQQQYYQMMQMQMAAQQQQQQQMGPNGQLLPVQQQQALQPQVQGNQAQFQPPQPPGVGGGFQPPQPPGAQQLQQPQQPQQQQPQQYDPQRQLQIDPQTQPQQQSPQQQQYDPIQPLQQDSLPQQDPQPQQDLQPQSQKRELTPEQIQEEYNKAYGAFWTTFCTENGREPTQDEWYAKWSNEILPGLQNSA